MHIIKSRERVKDTTQHTHTYWELLLNKIKRKDWKKTPFPVLLLLLLSSIYKLKAGLSQPRTWIINRWRSFCSASCCRLGSPHGKRLLRQHSESRLLRPHPLRIQVSKKERLEWKNAIYQQQQQQDGEAPIKSAVDFVILRPLILHSNPVITNHLGEAKICYKRDSLYPERISVEMEFFLGSIFAISGNSAYPDSL